MAGAGGTRGRRHGGRCRPPIAALPLVFGWLASGAPQAFAQFGMAPAELSGSVTLDEADSSVRGHLERIKAYVADRQWDEAVEALRQVMESNGGKMIALAPRR